MNRKQKIKKLDKLWSQIIRSRGKCERCNKDTTLAAHHINPRNKFNTRWDLENGVCLCYRCHIHWAHKDVPDAAEWFKERLGEKQYDDLKQRSNMSAKGQDLEAIEIYLESQND